MHSPKLFTDTMPESSLNTALRHFEATEANLVKAEKVLVAATAAIPQGIAFGDDPNYEKMCRDFDALFSALPTIDGWKPSIRLLELDEIAQNRFDAQEVGEVEAIIYTEQQITEPAKLLREYRYLFEQKRRELVRNALRELINSIDSNIRVLTEYLKENEVSNSAVSHDEFDVLKTHVAQITTLLGSILPKPPRWSELHRHLRFGKLFDLHDIIEQDWPKVKAGLSQSIYGENDPIPVQVADLGVLVSTKPYGPVAAKLNWGMMTDEDFERLIYMLISNEQGYENPEWLTKTNAPDRGRDLSVYRVYKDALSGTRRQRVIIQCKRWTSKSVGPTEVATLEAQMKLWEPPRIDVHVIATSGRFTSDAVAIVEKHNQSDSALQIEMWPESHLESLLAGRPHLIAEFKLR